jgi:hypothetical protein
MNSVKLKLKTTMGSAYAKSTVPVLETVDVIMRQIDSPETDES